MNISMSVRGEDALENDRSPGRVKAVSRAAAIPVAFGGTVGLYQPADPDASSARMAVLLVSPWGYEEICTHKFWRLIAEELAKIGIPSLRFDYIGTGDAPDLDAATWRPGAWHECVVKAANHLQQISGLKSVVLVGHGIGAAYAYEASKDIDGVAGLALLAPVTNGKSYLREVVAFSRMVGSLGASSVHGQFVIDGEAIPREITDQIAEIDVTASNNTGALPAFVATRGNSKAEKDILHLLTERGCDLQIVSYDEYADLFSSITLMKQPLQLLERLASWLKGIAAATPLAITQKAVAPGATCVITQPDFVEEYVRLGPGKRMYGVLCSPPKGTVSHASAILLGTSFERAAGRGRSNTVLARNLAKQGVTSLRFDAANVGNSPPVPGVPDMVLYDESQIADVNAAVSFVKSRNAGPVFVAGRCSGAYLAFRASLADNRISGVVMANAYTLEWDKRDSLEKIMLFVPQPLATYAARMISLAHWKKVFSGKVNVAQATVSISKLVRDRIFRALKPSLAKLRVRGKHSRLLKNVRELLDRRIRLIFLFSEGDVGLNYFLNHFDVSDGRMTEFPEIDFKLLKNADHGMLTAEGRAEFENAILRLASE